MKNKSVNKPGSHKYLRRTVQEECTWLLLLPHRLHAREADSQHGVVDGGRLKLSKRAESMTVLFQHKSLVKAINK